MLSHLAQTRMMWIALSVFVLVLSVWLLFVLVWWMRTRARKQYVERRLRAPDQPTEQEEQTRVLRLWHQGREATTIVPDTEAALTWRQKLERLPADAGWRGSIQQVLLRLILISVFVFALMWVLSNDLLVALLGVVAVWLVFWLYAKHCIARQRARFEKQLVDAMGLVARSLRAGHPLTGAFQLVAEEMESPIKEVFADICEQQALGVRLEEAVRNVADTAASPDLRLFATSVAIQMRSGGSLADLMDRLAFVIRDRMRLARRARVLTAQVQLSRRILLTVPFFLFLMLYLLNPDYMLPLFTTNTGYVLLATLGAAMVLGSWTMNRVAKVTY